MLGAVVFFTATLAAGGVAYAMLDAKDRRG